MHLKERISSQEGIPVVQQRLIFWGKPLEDLRALSDYNILPMSTIHLVLRLRDSSSSHIDVFIKQLTGLTAITSQINLARDEKIRSLKAMIYDREGIPSDQQQLFFAGRMLEDDHALDEYGIQHESTVQLALVLSPGPGNSSSSTANRSGLYTLYIRTLIGKTVTIKVVPNASIWNLKTKVFEAEGIPQDEQRMIYTGKQLEDDLTIRDYGVNDGDTVHLVLRLRGNLKK
jgi:ubiquitin C